MLPPRVNAAVPAVPVANHSNGLGIRRPDRETDAVDAFMLQDVSSEGFPQPLVAPFADQIEVDITKGRRESIRITDILPVTIRVNDFQAIPADWSLRQTQLEKSAWCASHYANLPLRHNGYFHRGRMGRADYHSPTRFVVATEHTMGVAMQSASNGFDLSSRNNHGESR